MRTLTISQCYLIEKTFCEDGTSFIRARKLILEDAPQSEITAQEIIDEVVKNG